MTDPATQSGPDASPSRYASVISNAPTTIPEGALHGPRCLCERCFADRAVSLEHTVAAWNAEHALQDQLRVEQEGQRSGVSIAREGEIAWLMYVGGVADGERLAASGARRPRRRPSRSVSSTR